MRQLHPATPVEIHDATTTPTLAQAQTGAAVPTLLAGAIFNRQDSEIAS